MKDFFEKFFIVEGILFGIIGILFFLRPFSTLVNLVNVCGVLIIVTGIFTLLRSFSSSTKIFLIINGIISILFGIILFISPIDTVDTVAILCGLWALIRGVYLFIISLKYKSLGFNFNTIYSILLVLLGLIILANPVIAIAATPYILGTYFVVMAICEIFLGFQI